jgi:nitrogenase molybdenum-iron protein beta chain
LGAWHPNRRPCPGREIQGALQILDLPIGLLATDRFVDALRQMAGVTVPDSLNLERGQLLDIITDMQAYFYHKKVGLVGDPDQLEALTEFLVDIDMLPVHMLTGTRDKAFEKRIKELTADLPCEVNVKSGGDMMLFHQWVKNEPVDLLIGNTYVKYIARDEDIPFIRHGFPDFRPHRPQLFSHGGIQGRQSGCWKRSWMP